MKYSKPLKTFLKAFHTFEKTYRKQIKENKDKQYKYFCDLYAKNITESDPTVRADDISNFLQQSFSYLLYKELKHEVTSVYFETQELKEFLVNTEIIDYRSLYDYILDAGNAFDVDVILKVVNENIKQDIDASKVKYLTYHFRIPNEEDAYSVVIFAIKDMAMVINLLHGDDVSVNMIPLDFEKDFKDHYRGDEDVTLICNFLYYILAFPESLIDGKPRDAERDEFHGTAPKQTLKTSPKIVETNEKQTRVTHFRKGHFRTLRSDYYKKMHNKVIFVHSTIVKGTPAKTLLD